MIFLDKLSGDISSFYTALPCVLAQMIAGGAFKIHKMNSY